VLQGERKFYCFDANDTQVILGAHMENHPIQMWDVDLHYLWTPNTNLKSWSMCVVHGKVCDLIASKWMPLTCFMELNEFNWICGIFQD
jgi:hypothetical protein